MVGGDLGKDAANLRLIAGPSTTAGSYVAGIEIAMAPGSHTYWKMPGEAGVPPVFSFDGSQNVAAAEVRFPTPTRITEEGLDAFGYGDHVVFPVAVTLQNRDRPAVLEANVSYAVCSKICLPAHGKVEIDLPGGATEAGGAAIAQALAHVPVAATAAETADLAVTPVPSQGNKLSWTVAWHGATPILDVFPNAPEGYFFQTRKLDAVTWRLTAVQTVSAPGSQRVPVELTLARPDGAGLAVTETLDVAPAAQ